MPKAGWALVNMDEMNLKEAQATGAVYHPRGLHGYDHEHPLMRAIFIARGPAFPHEPNSKVEPFRKCRHSHLTSSILTIPENIEVYNMLCDSVGIAPAPNNGTLRLPLKPIGLHDDPSTNVLDTPADPVQETHTISTAPAPEPTNPVQANPVTTSSAELAAPTVAVGVDQPVPQPQPTDQHSGSDSDDSGSDSDSDSDSDDEDDAESAADKVKGFWDWFTGKVGKWWGKVTGKEGDEEEGGEEGSSSG